VHIVGFSSNTSDMHGMNIKPEVSCIYKVLFGTYGMRDMFLETLYLTYK
jgi:hypothetical protein